MKKKKSNGPAKLAAVAGAALYLHLQNTWIQTTEYRVPIAGLALENEGLRIAHLSDLHLPNQRINLKKLAQLVEEEKPDLIFLTGDVIEADEPFKADEARALFQQLRKIAPVYAVSGNHDRKAEKWKDLLRLYRETGITFLSDEAYTVMLPGRAPVVVMGIADRRTAIQSQLLDGLRGVQVRPEWAAQTRLLLAHHPEYFEQYHKDAGKSPDLTFSGHAHGGQIRLPGVGGLFAPGQGKLPAHTAGVFALGQNRDKKLVISRGLGSTKFPFRINNRPELVMVTLTKQK